eukprot:1083149-Alexandrium_andersonii.AAC.1
MASTTAERILAQLLRWAGAASTPSSRHPNPPSRRGEWKRPMVVAEASAGFHSHRKATGRC